MADLYFAKVPIRNTYLRIAGKFARPDAFTEFIQRYDINLVFDVGANKGQYGRQLIRSGYQGRIVSFEPLPSAYEKLKLNRWSFSAWQCEPIALGSESGTATLNVAGNSQSSSLQGMLPSHIDAAPEAAYVATCEVPVKRLDEIFERYYRPGDRCYLKLDVQGHEHHVLAGASNCLDKVIALQLELSIDKLYEGELSWQPMIERLESLGYRLMLLTPGFRDRTTGQMMQADGVFIREDAIEQMRAA